jgi:hypothetical protein
LIIFEVEMFTTAGKAILTTGANPADGKTGAAARSGATAKVTVGDALVAVPLAPVAQLPRKPPAAEASATTMTNFFDRYELSPFNMIKTSLNLILNFWRREDFVQGRLQTY